MSVATCRKCGQTLAAEAAVCPFCGTANTGQGAPALGPVGTPAGAPLPSGNDPAQMVRLQGWNWGAFGLTWIWAFAHRATPWAIGMLILWVLTWIPMVHFSGLLFLAGALYLGAKGNEVAWQYRPFASVEEFERTERAWMVWGIVIFLLQVLLVIVAVVVAATLLASAVGSMHQMLTPPR